MVFDEYTKRRIIKYHREGYSPRKIAYLLKKEGVKASYSGVRKFLSKFKETGSTSRRAGSGRPSKLDEAAREIIERQMRKDDETTAVQLSVILSSRGYSVSLSTILRCRKRLGWTFRGSAYCQMLREANKVKQLNWARQYVHEAAAGFLDVIFTDETSIQLKTHRRFCCRKAGERPKPKPR